jgi:putative protease
MTARDSNRGGCCQACRWEFDLMADQKHVFASTDVQFSMSPKDLNLLRSVPEMIELGIDSLKIEGRMKSIHYIATVVSVYRKLIDLYCEDPDGFVFDDKLMDDLVKCANRLTAPAFFEGIPASDEQMFDNRDEHPTQDFIGLVIDYCEKTSVVTIEQRNHFKPGQIVEFFGPKIVTSECVVGEITDVKGEILDAARHPKQRVMFEIPFKVNPFDMMRKK